jgi:hypothetical protein
MHMGMCECTAAVNYTCHATIMCTLYEVINFDLIYCGTDKLNVSYSYTPIVCLEVSRAGFRI